MADPNALVAQQDDPAQQQKKAVPTSPLTPSSPTPAGGALPLSAVQPQATADPMAFAPPGGAGAPPVGAGAGSAIDFAGKAPAFDPNNPYLTNGTPFDFKSQTGSATPPAAPTAPTPPAPVSTPGALPLSNPFDPIADPNGGGPITRGELDRRQNAPVLSELEKSQNFVGSGGDVRDMSAAYGTGPDGKALYDPTKAAAITAGAPQAFADTQARQAADTAKQNAGNGAYDAAVSQADRLNDAQGLAKIGGLFSDNLDPSKTFADNGSPLPIGSIADYVAGRAPTAPTALGGGSPTPAPNNAAPTGPALGGGVASQLAAQASGGYTPPANGGVNLTSTNPDDALTSKTISANPNVNRVDTNNRALQSTIENVLNPALEAAQRSTLAKSFGGGRGVGGFNRTAQGNLASDYGRQLADLTNQSNASAVTGTIGDTENAANRAERQQGFQHTQEQDAVQNEEGIAALNEALTQGAFGRAQAQSNSGEANSPANIDLILSQIFGGQASGAGAAASGAANQVGQNLQGNSTRDAIMKALGF